MRHLALPAILALSACATSGTPTKHVTEVVNVPLRIECPAAPERARLRALRPVPLRQQPMPGSLVERVAKTAAQLGLYEAEGGWGDQIDTALDRCQRP